MLVSLATIKKYHKLSGSNNIHLILTVLEPEKSKVSAYLALDKGHLPDL